MNTDQVIRWQCVEVPKEQQSTCFQFSESVDIDGETRLFASDGFVVCVRGKIYAYKNRCPHAGSPLDWLPGQFFSEDGSQLVCHTHDARFDPASGECLSGPCPHGLEILPIRLTDNNIEVPSLLGLIDTQ
ncbi:MAG: Rieske (2Fe-2S) protein [Mariprofundaceae bacterium]